MPSPLPLTRFQKQFDLFQVNLRKSPEWQEGGQGWPEGQRPIFAGVKRYTFSADTRGKGCQT